MRHPDYPERICDISETDFWSQIRQKNGPSGNRLLLQAAKLGMHGRKNDAYTALAAYHRQTLARERDFLIAHGPPPAIHAPLQTADDVVRHRLYVSRAKVRHFGPIIEWDRWPAGSNLDSFYWILPLIEDYLQNPQQKYRQTLCDLVNQYYKTRNDRQFPSPHYHPVYTALSGSIKLRHLLPAYVALAANGDLDTQSTESFLKLFMGIARALYRRETDFVLSNQTITNAESFGWFACLFPEFRESKAMRNRAIERILVNIEKGFLKDGGYYERSLDYTLVALQDSSRALRMFERREPLDPATRRRFVRVYRRAGRFLAALLGPDDYAPPYADGMIARMSDILSDLLPFSPKKTPHGYGVDRSLSHLFMETGFAVMRGGGDREDPYVFFSFAPCHLWHSHQDCLTLDFWRFGKPLILEAGRFDGYSYPMDRLFRMPEMHNVPTVDAQSWDERYPERWKGEKVEWISTPEFDYACASHRAFAGPSPVTPHARNYRLRRAVIFIKKHGYLLVYDIADHGGQTPGGVISQHWHSPSAFRMLGPGHACTKGRTGVVVKTLITETLRRSFTKPDYLRKEVSVDVPFPERHSLQFQRWSDSSTPQAQGFATVIFPFHGRIPEIVIDQTLLRGGAPWKAERIRIRHPAGEEVFTLNPDHIKVASGKDQACTILYRHSSKP